MIKLVNDRKNKRKWSLLSYDDEGNPTVVADLNFVLSSSIIKKFDIVKNLIKELNTKVPEFSDWFEKLIYKYRNSGYNSELIQDAAPQILEFSKRYVDAKKINFSEFVNRKKISRTSILFDEEDIKSLAVASTCLKIYSIIKNDELMMVPDNVHRIIYNIFIKECIDIGTTDKIFELLRSRTYRSSITDKYIWDIIKMSILETPDSYIMVVFNFIMSNLISTLDIDSNPVKYITSIVDDKIRWLMSGIYKEQVIYGEAFGGTEDVYGTSQTKESFHLYGCNDVIAKIAKIALEIITHEYEVSDDDFLKIRYRLDEVKNIDPSMKLVTLPIASKVFEIPYRYLLTTPPKHIVLMGVFLHHLAQDILDKRFPILMDFLLSSPRNINSLVVKSSYRIKNIEYLIEDNEKIFGFNSKTLKYETISPICGILSTCKKNLVSILDGIPMSSITYNDLESDIVNFYNELYSGILDSSFEKMKKKADNYF